VAFYRKIAQTRNAIIWYEEYSEKVSPEKQEALKNFADGFGRVTGQMTNNNKTKSTPVLNACIISGQILPSHDPALLERCVTLFFDKFYGDKKSAIYGEQFKAWSNDGLFAYVAAEIYSHRTYIKENFAEMSYKNLMRVFFENDQFSDYWIGRDNSKLQMRKDWQSAYAKFRDLRTKRDEQIYSLVTETVRHIARNNSDSSTFVIPVDCVRNRVAEKVISLYRSITPFDCEDEKFQSRYSWDNRVTLAVGKCVNQFARKETKKGWQTVQWVNGIDLRK
jgi:hypothetical protein